MFTGDNITFIYPDLAGELYKKGSWLRLWLKGGLKELRFHVTWIRDVANDYYIGGHVMIIGPHERTSVYITDSVGGKDDGVFAFLSQMICCLILMGLRQQTKTFHRKMTDEEAEHAGT
jgi:hypothetical protein